MKKIIVIVTAFAVLFSCSKPQKAQPGAFERSFVPGECLADTELYLKSAGEFKDDIYAIELGMNWTTKFDALGWVVRWGDATRYRIIPAKEVYSQFVDNKKNVENEYEKVYEQVMSTYQDLRDIRTVYYDGGMSLTANYDFAGIKAGEDLSSLFELYSFVPKEKYPIPDNGFEFAHILEGDSVILTFPKDVDFGGRLEFEFTLTLPVKVGLYLTWLDNLLADPDAPYPYSEETLTCTFTVSAEALERSL